jgi:transposase-like protein
MIKTNRRISDDLKRRVVLDVLSGKLSKEEARRVYDIRGKSAVTDWIRRFENEFSHLENPILCLPLMGKSKKTASLEDLQSEIERLRHELTIEQHKSGLYKSMVEVAEERFNIEIRKKSGAKQSSNTRSK